MIGSTRAAGEDSARLSDAALTASSGIREVSDGFREFIDSFAATEQGMARASGEMSQIQHATHEVNARLTRIAELSATVESSSVKAWHDTVELARSSEHVQELVARFALGQGALEENIQRVSRAVAQVSERMGALLAQGVNFFDTHYQPVPGSEPAKFKTVYDERFAQEFQSLFDECAKGLVGGKYALCTDHKGYAPTHNSWFSRPPTGDRATDLVNSRDKRMFNDPTGARCAANVQPMLLQTYVRDTGEVLSDLSMPVHLNGRHWGCLRVGFDPAEVLARA